MKGAWFAVAAVGVLLAGLTSSAKAEDGKFIDFVVKNVNDRGFVGCDAVVRNAFKTVGGEDVRVLTSTMDVAKDRSLELTVAWGKAGDAILAEARLYKKQGVCAVSMSVDLIASKSCTMYLAEMENFRVTAETAGIVFTKNERGGVLILRPLGNTCVARFQFEIV